MNKDMPEKAERRYSYAIKATEIFGNSFWIYEGYRTFRFYSIYDTIS